MRPRLAVLASLLVLLAAAPAHGAVLRRSFDAAPATFRYRIGPGQDLRVTVPIHGEIAMPTTPGRHPLVLVMHGRHQWCTQVRRARREVWRCPDGQREVPSHAGYTYLLEALARRGFAVASVSVNAATAVEDVSGSPFSRSGTCPQPAFCVPLWNGMDFRARVADALLLRLRAADRGGANPFRVPLAGRLDLDHVGLVGHSRGGEGVVTAAALFGASAAYTIRGVFVVSPVDFKGRVVPDDIALGSVISYCDGDVSDQQGMWFLDHVARRPDRRRPTYQVVAYGANHNFFNRVWGDEVFSFDPEGGPSALGACAARATDTLRLTRPAQESLLTSLVVPFMEREVAGRPAAADALGAGPTPPRRLDGAAVVTTFLPPAGDRRRLVGPGGSPRTVSGAGLVGTGLSLLETCDPRDPCGSTQRTTFPRAVWTLHVRFAARGASLRVPLTRAQGDARAFTTLALRAAVEPQPPEFDGGGVEGGAEPPVDVNPQVVGQPQSFSVVLEDRAGHRATVVVPPTAAALRYPPGGDQYQRTILGSIRVPLAGFRGVDRAHLRAITLVFDQTDAGSLYLADLELQRATR